MNILERVVNSLGEPAKHDLWLRPNGESFELLAWLGNKWVSIGGGSNSGSSEEKIILPYEYDEITGDMDLTPEGYVTLAKSISEMPCSDMWLSMNDGTDYMRLSLIMSIDRVENYAKFYFGINCDLEELSPIGITVRHRACVYEFLATINKRLAGAGELVRDNYGKYITFEGMTSVDDGTYFRAYVQYREAGSSEFNYKYLTSDDGHCYLFFSRSEDNTVHSVTVSTSDSDIINADGRFVIEQQEAEELIGAYAWRRG